MNLTAPLRIFIDFYFIIMAKTSVLSRPLPNVSLPRNSFSRGFLTNFNMSAGMLIPVFCKEVPKGSHGRINRSIFMRTAQLNTAAFPKLDCHIDFFKVPKRLLMSRYEEMITNISDVNSTALHNNTANDFAQPQTAPYFKRSDYYNYIESGAYLDVLGFNVKYGARRLLDYLGYDAVNCMRAPGDPSDPQGTDPFECNLNAFRLLAYQKIYFDHFRNTNYEANNPYAYNADKYYQSSTPGYIQPSGLADIMRLRYVNIRKDYFTNIYPSLNYAGSQGNWSLPSSVVGATVAGFNSSSQPFINNIAYSQQPSPSVVSSSAAGGNYAVSVQQIRAAFALDKLMRASSYAPKHVKDQIEARFGVKCKQSYGHESEYLGSFMNDIVIGEVTSTADTYYAGGAQLGTIGGKGVSGSQSGKTIEFDTYEDDCIIMGVMYCLVRGMYDSTRIDIFNTKFTREDYFQPEFMDLGLRPLLQYELETVHGLNASTYSNTIRGYVPRYQEYKLSVDENHGLFNDGNILSIFVPHFDKSLVQNTPTGNGVSAPYFKMSPAHLNSIFAQNWDVTDQNTDQFYGQCQFKFDVRQNMSVHGQPRL